MGFINFREQPSATVFQIIAVLTGTLSTLSDSMQLGWTSPIGPKLLTSESPIKADESDIALLEFLECLLQFMCWIK
ncbi:hypothetical protein FQA39_LY01967 [Lamprigera yunnana]|nr:hypothetical protein FQA39_LY01967 [Lamprigera yunnana]